MPAVAMPDEGEGAPQPRIVYRTAVASLLVQLAVFLVTSASFFVPLPAAEREGLEAIFALELTSQFVEMAWYTVVVCRYRTILTWTRYADWVVSTPLMLLSLALFFYHRRGRPVWDVGAAPALYASLALNWAMLAAGFAVERGRAPRAPGLAAGFAALAGSFVCLGTLLDARDGASVGLFGATAAVWALYGVAAALRDVPKNVGYNALDVVSKNIYGVFLFGYSVARRAP